MNKKTKAAQIRALNYAICLNVLMLTGVSGYRINKTIDKYNERKIIESYDIEYLSNEKFLSYIDDDMSIQYAVETNKNIEDSFKPSIYEYYNIIKEKYPSIDTSVFVYNISKYDFIEKTPEEIEKDAHTAAAYILNVSQQLVVSSSSAKENLYHELTHLLNNGKKIDEKTMYLYSFHQDKNYGDMIVEGMTGILTKEIIEGLEPKNHYDRNEQIYGGYENIQPEIKLLSIIIGKEKMLDIYVKGDVSVVENELAKRYGTKEDAQKFLQLFDEYYKQFEKYAYDGEKIAEIKQSELQRTVVKETMKYYYEGLDYERLKNDDQYYITENIKAKEINKIVDLELGMYNIRSLFDEQYKKVFNSRNITSLEEMENIKNILEQETESLKEPSLTYFKDYKYMGEIKSKKGIENTEGFSINDGIEIILSEDESKIAQYNNLVQLVELLSITIGKEKALDIYQNGNINDLKMELMKLNGTEENATTLINNIDTYVINEHYNNSHDVEKQSQLYETIVNQLLDYYDNSIDITRLNNDVDYYITERVRINETHNISSRIRNTSGYTIDNALNKIMYTEMTRFSNNSITNSDISQIIYGEINKQDNNNFTFEDYKYNSNQITK